jgi:diguanylate cyclase (GGDEF)-like protein
VDDEPDKRQLLQFALEAEGYKVITANDGVEGLAAVEMHRPDLIVTDVPMPNMDGYEMIRRIRANPQTRFIPIIIQTAARSATQDVRFGAEVGALGYITDPTDLDLLRARARTLLEFKSYLDSAEEAAFTDDLTSLANGRRFKRQLEREVARTRRYGHPFCLFLLEVDGFARLTERLGREAGEEILRHVGDVLMAGTRGIDTAARLEQALFAVIITETGYESTSEVVERLRSEIAELTTPSVDERITVSAGLVEFPTAAQDAATLLGAAHAVLAETKRSRRAAFERALKWVKDFVSGRDDRPDPPSCFISYAWSTPEDDDWVARLAKDLDGAGIKPILDRRDNAAIGSNIARFISRIETSDFIIVVGTPLYLEKYRNKTPGTGRVAAAEMDLINTRLLGTEEEKNSVLPLLREGEPKTALPSLIQGRVCGNFRYEENYLESLFDLILTLYGIPFNHATAEGFRDSLRSRARLS